MAYYKQQHNETSEIRRSGFTAECRESTVDEGEQPLRWTRVSNHHGGLGLAITTVGGLGLAATTVGKPDGVECLHMKSCVSFRYKQGSEERRVEATNGTLGPAPPATPHIVS